MRLRLRAWLRFDMLRSVVMSRAIAMFGAIVMLNLFQHPPPAKRPFYSGMLK